MASSQNPSTEQEEVIPIPAEAKPAEDQTRCRRFCSWLLVALIVVGILGFVVFIMLLSLTSSNVTVHVEYPSLSAFNLSSSNTTLRYHLSVDLILRNKVGGLAFLRYDQLQADGYYNGEYLFQTASLPSFSRWGRISKTVRLVLAGESRVELGKGGAEFFRKQEREGKFDLQVNLSWRLTNKLAKMKFREKSNRVKCWLEDLKPDGSSPTRLGFRGLWTQVCKFY